MGEFIRTVASSCRTGHLLYEKGEIVSRKTWIMSLLARSYGILGIETRPVISYSSPNVSLTLDMLRAPFHAHPMFSLIEDILLADKTFLEGLPGWHIVELEFTPSPYPAIIKGRLVDANANILDVNEVLCAQDSTMIRVLTSTDKCYIATHRD